MSHCFNTKNIYLIYAFRLDGNITITDIYYESIILGKCLFLYMYVYACITMYNIINNSKVQEICQIL